MAWLLFGRKTHAKPSQTDGFDVFISYSHAADEQLAPALQQGLQSLGKPWYQRRALRVARDKTTLSANPELWGKIAETLRSSRYFILLASPEAARSHWVNQEVRWWLTSPDHGPGRMLIALTDGELAWDGARGGFDRAQCTALPPAMMEWPGGEPRWVELRWAHKARHLPLRDPRFREAVADLAAPVHGRDKDELIGEDIRQHRRSMRLARSAVTALVILTVLAIAAAGVAVNRQRAAERQQRIATARGLVAQADAARDSDPRTALLLGLAAQRLHRHGETEAGLVNTLTATNYAGTLTDQGQQLYSVAFAPDGRTLATASSGQAILWDLTDRAGPRRLGQPLSGHRDAVTSVAFAADGRTLATASGDRTVRLWDLANRARPRRLGRPLSGHRALVVSVVFAPDGRTLATASGDRTVRLWDLADRARPRRLGEPIAGQGDLVWKGALWSVAFAPNSRTLATASDDQVLLWDLTDRARPRRLPQTLRGHRDSVRSMAFTPDGRTLATTSDDQTAILWDLADPTQPRVRRRLTGHRNPVWSVAVAPHGRILATAAGDEVMLWDLVDPVRPRLIGPPLGGHSQSVRALAVAPDGRTVAAAGPDRVVVWSLADPARPRRLAQAGTGYRQRDSVASVVLSPDGRTAAAAGAARVILWDAADPTRVRPFNPGGRVTSLAVAADSRTLATANLDRAVLLWDLTDPAQPRQLGQPLTGHNQFVSAVAFGSDGRTVAAASGTEVTVWDVADPARPRRLGQPLTGHRDTVFSMAFAPDGRTLATASTDQTVIVWDLADPARPRRLSQPLSHPGQVHAVAFAPDGRTLATATLDQVFLWNLTELDRLRRHAVERACALTPRGLDREVWARYVTGLRFQPSCPG